MSDGRIAIPAGLVCLTSYGPVRVETTQSLINLARHAERMGLTNLEFVTVSANLVDKARNSAAEQLLKSPGQFIWFLDADMVFAPQLVETILRCAFEECPWADIVGGYANLRGEPYLPTIDRGSGHWESHDANIGPVEVIRTGAACLLVKRQVFERMAYPWFGIRPAPRILDCLAEVDGFARQKYDGKNPLAQRPEWAKLMDIAQHVAREQSAKAKTQADFYQTVGEDSGFCDRAKALGFRIVVETRAICGHVDTRTIWPSDHMEAIRESQQRARYFVGALE